MSDLRGYDSWLERPYQEAQAQEPPAAVEDVLDQEFWLDGERAAVASWESWTDADEDDKHAGVDLVICVGGSRHPRYDYWTGGRTRNMSLGEFEDVMATQDEHKGDET